MEKTTLPSTSKKPGLVDLGIDGIEPDCSSNSSAPARGGNARAPTTNKLITIEDNFIFITTSVAV
jgi:hypothetical protein